MEVTLFRFRTQPACTRSLTNKRCKASRIVRHTRAMTLTYTSSKQNLRDVVTKLVRDYEALREKIEALEAARREHDEMSQQLADQLNATRSMLIQQSCPSSGFLSGTYFVINKQSGESLCLNVKDDYLSCLYPVLKSGLFKLMGSLCRLSAQHRAKSAGKSPGWITIFVLY